MTKIFVEAVVRFGGGRRTAGFEVLRFCWFYDLFVVLFFLSAVFVTR